MANINGGGEADATRLDSVEAFFALGLICATGAAGEVDLVSAHKWFNIAAMRGHAEAVRHRREIAAEMSEAEVGRAQRAARDWLCGCDAAGELRSAA